MIRQEILIINNKKLIKTYSDDGKYIIQIQTGLKYPVVIDIPNRFSYIESSENLTKEDVLNG